MAAHGDQGMVAVWQVMAGVVRSGRKNTFAKTGPLPQSPQKRIQLVLVPGLGQCFSDSAQQGKLLHANSRKSLYH